jgi:UDP-N-acetylglucosamine acyltransferase
LANVSPEARLGVGVSIGAFASVEADVELGDHCVVASGAVVKSGVKAGSNNEFCEHAVIGGAPQHAGRPQHIGRVVIGEGNVFREYVTVHAATFDDEFTVIGSDNTILAYSHIAHDCIVGDHCVMSNGTMLAGHVIVEDHVIIGGYGGVHQFCRLGAYAMLSATAKLVQDLPPFFIADGTPAIVRAYNKVGLERNGHTPEQLDRVKQIFRILYRDGLNRTQALEKLAAHPEASSAEFQRVIAFAAKSTRGLTPGA